MADVQIAVGLRRETGVDLHALVLAAGCKILRDEIVDKIAALGALRLLRGDNGFVFLAHIALLLIVKYISRKNTILLYRSFR